MNPRFDAAQALHKIRTLKFKGGAPWPRVLFDAGDVPVIRQRAEAMSGVMDAYRAAADGLLRTAAEDPNQLQAYVGGSEALIMAQAYLMTQNEAYARWAKVRIAAVLALDTWRAPVHGTMVCDHCMGNIAAQVALCFDLLSRFYSPAETDALLDGMRRHILLPFLEATDASKPIWWFQKQVESNWKIMTCGDAGLAFCAFADRWPEGPEALARAANGVIETLDAVPAEGDWPEGFGYWFHTLRLGLRFARALRRVAGGEVDLFQHPALRTTGNFATALATPGGRVYNFSDNMPVPDEGTIETIAMLALELRRGDLMAIARQFPAKTPSPTRIICEDPAVASAPAVDRVGYFPRTGIATMRTGWKPGDTFIGFKSGPSAVGHSHLDANSFIIESRGERLAFDNPYWPQAHFIGFFDTNGPRWNFDGNGTIGHSTLLIDGKGQTHGGQFPAAMRAPRTTVGDGLLAVGDASLAYPGLLRKFVRSILLLAPDTVVIRDVVECEGDRHAEWLLQHNGSVRSEGAVTIIETNGVPMSLTPLLPDRSGGWRTNDATRTSTYINSDTLREEVRSVRYRGFSTFQPASRFEFLFAIRIGDDGSIKPWQFEGTAGAWSLGIADLRVTVRPTDDELAVTGPDRA